MEVRSCAGKAHPSCRRRPGCRCHFRSARFPACRRWPATRRPHGCSRWGRRAQPANSRRSAIRRRRTCSTRICESCCRRPDRPTWACSEAAAVSCSANRAARTCASSRCRIPIRGTSKCVTAIAGALSPCRRDRQSRWTSRRARFRSVRRITVSTTCHQNHPSR